MLARSVFVLFILLSQARGESWQQARKLYYEAVRGNESSREAAAGMLDRLLQGSPGNATYSAYRGSLLLLESAKAFAPWKKGRLAKEGLRMMDAAVTQAPQDLEIRFVRAASTRTLPGFFKRAEESARDLAQLAPQVRDAVRSGKLEPMLASAALLYHSRNLQDRGDTSGASQACSTAIEIAPGTPAAGECSSRVQKSKLN